MDYKTHVLEYTAQQKDAGLKLMDVLHQSMDLSGRMIRRSKKRKRNKAEQSTCFPKFKN